MRLRLASTILLPALAASPASAQPARRAFAEARELYQGRRGPEQSDTFSRKFKIGRDGRVSVANVAGDITVTATGGDEVSVDAVKHTRGSRSGLDDVRILVDDRPGGLDIRTDYDRVFRNSEVSVDYTIAVPAGVALDVRSVSGRIHVTGVKGAVRLNAISGAITSVETPRVEYARTVSGEIELGGVSHDNTLSLSSVSGGIQVNGLKARSIDLSTVSGDVRLRDAACERLSMKSVSGGFEYAGTLARNGRYDVNSHSGPLRWTLADNTGFTLDAGSFSGSIRSDFPMTVGGDRSPEISRGRRRGPGGDSMHAAFGDGSASLNLHTFSGDIVIAKR